MRLPLISKGYVLFSALHIVCFALALAVIGLYAQDLDKASKNDKPADHKWVYAVVVGALSAVTCLVYFIPFFVRAGGIFMAGWNFILFVLWIALFGVFADMYLDEDPEGDGGIKRMKNAIWVDLTNAILWLIATIAAGGHWWKTHDPRSRFTGRAHV